MIFTGTKTFLSATLRVPLALLRIAPSRWSVSNASAERAQRQHRVSAGGHSASTEWVRVSTAPAQSRCGRAQRRHRVGVDGHCALTGWSAINRVHARPARLMAKMIILLLLTKQSRTSNSASNKSANTRTPSRST